ncbi:hypothetical protein M011DRAFT_283553 [Sporormia fimetaria CBS 119925]|uniref:Uncharacterized protein n=1 Tax=Sporormia fimetaria CBS 119925 TaxID=1340428 RepID=A0A6A6VLC1_9PLEO|nr:hypothetical protein M011DRAFT_283553 [Sporormia fimetaria CBS 119925]
MMDASTRLKQGQTPQLSSLSGNHHAASRPNWAAELSVLAMAPPDIDCSAVPKPAPFHSRRSEHGLPSHRSTRRDRRTDTSDKQTAASRAVAPAPSRGRTLMHLPSVVAVLGTSDIVPCYTPIHLDRQVFQVTKSLLFPQPLANPNPTSTCPHLPLQQTTTRRSPSFHIPLSHPYTLPSTGGPPLCSPP